MTKKRKDIANIIAKHFNVNESVADACVLEILDEIRNWIANGDDIEIRGFGTLYAAKQEARLGRVVKRGEEVVIPARMKPKFRPTKSFIEMCNNK